MARIRIRDLALTLVPGSLLAALLAFRGDVSRLAPESSHDSLRTHYIYLLHSGHVPGGVFIGILLAILAATGVLGLLGDSPLDVRGDETLSKLPSRPFWKREGFWLVAGCALLYLPLAGAYGFWDPWETHYAEVAREVLARDDWVTLWWGQEGWFLSKPVLTFWLAALGMDAGSTFGLSFSPDHGPGAHEWFVRLPVALLAIAAVYALYRAVRSAFGPRPALCVGLVLATSPQWFLIAHQTMTDMPFVAPMVGAMAFAMMAVIAPQDSLVESRVLTLGGIKLRVSAWHLVVVALVLVALPQSLYLLTRPMTTQCAAGDTACETAMHAARMGSWQWPVERFAYGSAGNSVPGDALASVPGSPAWESRFGRAPFFPSPAQGVLWLGLLAGLLYSLRNERRKQALFFVAAYVCSALSFLGKGPAGIGLPELVVLVFVLCSWRGGLLKRAQVLRGIAVFAVCGLPWYVAMFGRLGREFFDRFVVHDLLDRAFAGVHGDTGTFRYFVTQLGFGLFPWTALAPMAVFAPRLFLARDATSAQRDVVRMAALWFALAFTLFSLMVTKFHHYILPAVPALAVPTGLLLHRLITDEKRSNATRVALGAAATLGLIAWDFAYAGPGRPAGAERLIHLFVYNYERAFPAGALAFGRVMVGFALVGCALCLALAWPRARRTAALGMAALAACFTLWALDGYIPALSAHWSQRGLFERYYAARSGPEERVAAFQMNWKGENFYTGNHAAMLECGLPLCHESPREWLPGALVATGRVFVVTERGREAAVESLARGAGATARALSTAEDNNHFVLLEVQK